MKCAWVSPTSRPRNPYFSLASTTMLAALRRLVGERRQLRRVRELAARSRRAAGRNAVACRLPRVIVPVLSSSSMSTSPDGLHRTTGHRHHVEADQPVHAGDADRRQEPADRRRDQADEQRDQHGDREGCRRHRLAKTGMVATAIRKMSVRPASRTFSAISFGVFCRSAPSTSLIMRSRKVEPGAAVTRTTMPVGQHLRAAGDRLSGPRPTRGSPAPIRR